MAAGDVKVSLTKNRAFNGAVFNGTNAIVNTTLNTTKFNSSLPFTISFWIKTKDAAATSRGIFSRWENADPKRDFSFQKSTANKVRFQVSADGLAGTIVSKDTTVSIADDQWHHIVGVFNGTWVQVYGDGTAGTTSNTAVNNQCTTSNVKIGFHVGATNSYLLGSLREILIYNVALTNTEILSLYAGNLITRGLIYRYPLSEGYDDVINGEAGTNSNATLATIEDAVGAAVKAQRVAATDKWMIYRGQEGQVGTVEIEGA